MQIWMSSCWKMRKEMKWKWNLQKTEKWKKLNNFKKGWKNMCNNKERKSNSLTKIWRKKRRKVFYKCINPFRSLGSAENTVSPTIWVSLECLSEKAQNSGLAFLLWTITAEFYFSCLEMPSHTFAWHLVWWKSLGRFFLKYSLIWFKICIK